MFSIASLASGCAKKSSLRLAGLQIYRSNTGFAHPRTFPNYSSAKDGESLFCKSPGLDTIGNLLATGKPNVPFPEEVNIDVAEFANGALMASEVVTHRLVASNEAVEDEDMVTSGLIERVQESQFLRSLTDYERSRLAVDREDVYFHWIADATRNKKSGIQTVRFVTMSYPGYAQIRSLMTRREQILRSHDATSGNEIKEELQEINDKLMPMLQEVKLNQFVVSNFVFVRDYLHDENSSWKVNEVAINGGRLSYSVPFYYRWKMRLWFCMRGMPMEVVLRLDYSTDIIFLSFVTGSFLASYVGIL